MPNIVTHLGIDFPWVAYKNGHNTFTITFTSSGSAFNISAYTFVVNIRRIGSSTNVLQLTQGVGVTNGTTTGILTVDLSQTHASTTLPGTDYFYEVGYTVNEKYYALLEGGLKLLSESNPGETTSSVSLSVSLAGTNVSAAITLATPLTSSSITSALGYTPANDSSVVHKTGDETVAGVKTFSSSPIILLTTNRQTASYTLVLTDAGKLVEMNVGSANNLTVPPNSSVAFATGTQILISQYGAGQTTIVAGSGVTVRSDSGKLKINVQYGGATLVKIATDEWYLFGNITT
jgi:hypothetical protein